MDEGIYWKTHEQLQIGKGQQLPGNPTDRTKQANFDAVASSETVSILPTTECSYDFGGVAITTDNDDRNGGFAATTQSVPTSQQQYSLSMSSSSCVDKDSTAL
ncbi:hypothetical protein N7516_009774 [Penicillium verrucosum]|uniref:uncharacterized protein n=1 Tax=Penicillium verrucosum TaxID=60171 RepID=UPI0025459AFD|nr:uncharacterized protein N7516_009774 [Penicillium verrucosum]KAJ5922071.1 hypothetical protein N7516_009774 [Penicillium verrucosum]